MNKGLLLTFFLLWLFTLLAVSQTRNVGIGTTTPDASSILDLKANDKGVLVPRVTTAQRLVIANPAEALLVYDLTVGCFFYYKNTQWVSLCGGQGGNAGPTGATGLPGENGLDGATGPQGPAGTTGLPGDTGPQGSTGGPGQTGPTGADGTNGLNGPGYLATSVPMPLLQ